jgi:poly(A) polymerase
MIREFIKSVLGKGKKSRSAAPHVLPKKQHGLSRDAIHPCALKVCEDLQHQGYQAFVVGGAVRDLLLGGKPKDYDVATDATPEEIRRLFRRSRIIGRRFKIVHVMCGRDTIEVTTFRSAGNPVGDEDDERETDEHGRLLSDNIFGNLEQDAARRDFTVNALYYDPEKEEIWDYHGGVADSKKRILRVIGDPETRYREDPVRMLRAARFAAKLEFKIDPDARAPVARLAPLLENVPRARLFDEALKLLLSGHALRAVHQLRAEGLHHGMLPLLDTILDDPQGERFISAALRSTDERIHEDKPASPGFLFASLLWPQVQRRWLSIQETGERPIPALFVAMDEVLEAQRERLAIPRRHDGFIKETWALQPRFEQRAGQRPFRLMEHPRFRAGYDFLLIRAESGEVNNELAEWWTHFQDADADERLTMLVADTGPKTRKRRKRRKPAGEKSTDSDVDAGADPA